MSNLKITAFIMGISHPKRIEWLKKNISNLDHQNFPFYKKIVSIDKYSNYSVDNETLLFLQNNGWTVLLDYHRSRPLSMERALKLIDGDVFTK